MRIYVKIEGLDEIQRKLGRTARRDVKIPLSKAGEIIYGSVIRNFEEQGRPKWPPRSPLTQSVMEGAYMEKVSGTKRYQKAVRGKTKAGILHKAVETARGHKILQVSGDLRKSITIDPGETEVRIGVPDSIKYARIHQFGGVIRPKRGRFLRIPTASGGIFIRQAKIPARPFLMIQKEDEGPIIRVFRDWMVEAAK